MSETSIISALVSLSTNYHYLCFLFIFLTLILILGAASCADLDSWFFGHDSLDDSDSPPEQKYFGVKNKEHHHRSHQHSKKHARHESGSVMAADLKALATRAKVDPSYDSHTEGLLLLDRDFYLNVLKEGKTKGSVFTRKSWSTSKLSASGHPILQHSTSSKSKTTVTKKTETFKVKSNSGESGKSKSRVGKVSRPTASDLAIEVVKRSSQH